MKIFHIISGLGDGGAEAVLFRLCQSNPENEHVVMSLTTRGKYAELFESIGVTVYSLNMTRGLSAILRLPQVCRTIALAKPDLVQTWMYHADLIGGVAGRIACKSPVYWGVHNTALVFGRSRLATILICRVNAVLSRILPTSIIYCAESSRRAHEEIGYCANRANVIYNGYDLDIFRPRPDEREQYREIFGLSSEDFLIGMVARFDPIKDHNNVCAAIKNVLASGASVKLMMIGSGITSENAELIRILTLHGLEGKVLLLGARTDVNRIMPAFDICVLSSLREAFPNVLAEAMACGVPCVSTDVGDAAEIIGETGWIVPPQDPIALAKSLLQARAAWAQPELWDDRKKAARERIDLRFSLRRMVAAYNESWSS